ncbi:MAG: TlyA family RNA methyltransferase [Candidatus Bipolaricaulaceae bacterium]
MPGAAKRRLDQLLVSRGQARSRAAAQALIRAGEVRVEGQVVDKPGTQVPCQADISVARRPRYASRGGNKLEGALDAFGIHVPGRVCLDVGASTGGFTDCLLQHGAAHVYAVDVGRGQLDWRLRNHPRVTVREGVNARHLRPEHIGEPVDLVTIDVSFISLRLVLPPLRGLVTEHGDVIALVKPQFEASRREVRRGGVVRDLCVRQHVVAGVAQFARAELTWSVVGAVPSALPGPAGNVEFFLHLVPRPGEDVPVDWAQLVATAAG